MGFGTFLILFPLALLLFLVSAAKLVLKGREDVLLRHLAILLIYGAILSIAGKLLPEKAGMILFNIAGMLGLLHFAVLLLISFKIEASDAPDAPPAKLREMELNEQEEAKALAESEDEDGNWIFGDDWKEEMEDG